MPDLSRPAGLPAARDRQLAEVHLTHPTQPEATSRGNRDRYAEAMRAMRAMLANWNHRLEVLFSAVGGSDVQRDLVPYVSTPPATVAVDAAA